MGKQRAYPVRTDTIMKIMDDRNISQVALARATQMSTKAIANILHKVSEPFEDTLVSIAAVLGVKWRSLIECYDGDAESAEEGGGIATRRMTRFQGDYAEKPGETEEQALARLLTDLRDKLPHGYEIVIRRTGSSEQKGEDR